MTMVPNQTWLRNKFECVREICDKYELNPYAMYTEWQKIRYDPTCPDWRPYLAKQEILALKDMTKGQRKGQRLRAQLMDYKPFDKRELDVWLHNKREHDKVVKAMHPKG